MQAAEACERASFLLTDNAGIWHEIYVRETEPEQRKIHYSLYLRREKLIPEISKDELWNEYNGCPYA